MKAEIMLSDGTKLVTQDNVNTDQVIQNIGTTAGSGGEPRFLGVVTAKGDTFRVNPEQIVYLRDVD